MAVPRLPAGTWYLIAGGVDYDVRVRLDAPAGYGFAEGSSAAVGRTRAAMDSRAGARPASVRSAPVAHAAGAVGGQVHRRGDAPGGDGHLPCSRCGARGRSCGASAPSSS